MIRGRHEKVGRTYLYNTAATQLYNRKKENSVILDMSFCLKV